MILVVSFLGERAGRWRWGAVMVSLIGALLITKPGTDAFQPAALIALLSAVFLGAESYFTKRIAQDGIVRVMLVNGGIGTAFSALPALYVWQMPDQAAWMLLIAVGWTMAIGQSLYLFVLQKMQASHVMPLFYTTLVYAAIYDLALYSVVPDWIAAVGMVMIAGGAGVIAWRQARATTRPSPDVAARADV